MTSKKSGRLHKDLASDSEAGPSSSDSALQYARLQPAFAATTDAAEDFEERNYYDAMMKRYLAGSLNNQIVFDLRK